MNAKQLSAAAQATAEKVKGLNPNSLEYSDAVTSGFRDTGNDPADYPVFREMVKNHRTNIQALEKHKLPSEIAATAAKK